MSDLSVLTVQNALKMHAKSGHDIINNPGVTLSDRGTTRNYPVRFGSMLTIDHDDLPEHMLTTLIPLGESANIARVTSLPYDFKNNKPRWVSRSVANPHIFEEDGQRMSFYMPHAGDKRSHPNSSDEDMHEYLKRSSQLPSRLTTHSSSPYGYRPRELDFSHIRHHDPAEAAWHELARSTWSAPDKPDNINLRNIGNVVLVNHHPTQSLSLYLPDSERLLRV